MLHSVDFDVWDPAAHRSHRASVVVDAVSGDDAVSQAQVKALGEYPGQGIKIVACYPVADQPPPAAAVEGAEADPDPMDADGDGKVSKAELIAEAERRGVTVDRRWGVDRLREALA